MELKNIADISLDLLKNNLLKVPGADKLERRIKTELKFSSGQSNHSIFEYTVVTRSCKKRRVAERLLKINPNTHL